MRSANISRSILSMGGHFNNYWRVNVQLVKTQLLLIRLRKPYVLIFSYIYFQTTIAFIVHLSAEIRDWSQKKNTSLFSFFNFLFPFHLQCLLLLLFSPPKISAKKEKSANYIPLLNFFYNHSFYALNKKKNKIE